MNPNSLHLNLEAEIKSCETNRAYDLYCKYSFAYGGDWIIETGCEEGVTQTGKKDSDGVSVWNFPIEASFQASKPFGWPQIIVAVYGTNLFGQEVIVGYGAVHVPTRTGSETLNVPLYTRAPSSLFQKFVSSITGANSEAISLNIVADGDTREILKTESEGFVRVKFDVSMIGLTRLDLSV